MGEDIRWKQRLQNYQKALAVLGEAVCLAASRELSNLEKQGLIQAFEFSFELAWNLMKDYLEAQGITGIIGSKGAVRQAFSAGLIAEGQVWMDMIRDRTISSHSYDEDTARDLSAAIRDVYHGQLRDFARQMESREE
ncbi:MAG: nucleotidyltransferase substrate binding protein [Spirochaetia bacterium]|nr:nucleotidyltransferase substrate binding protein [Spirochaetia bacterium]